jgi:hypothetical protein
MLSALGVIRHSHHAVSRNARVELAPNQYLLEGRTRTASALCRKPGLTKLKPNDIGRKQAA